MWHFLPPFRSSGQFITLLLRDLSKYRHPDHPIVSKNDKIVSFTLMFAPWSWDLYMHSLAGEYQIFMIDVKRRQSKTARIKAPRPRFGYKIFSQILHPDDLMGGSLHCYPAG
jgi:hypothetical protein